MTLEQLKIWIRNAYEAHDRSELERALAYLDAIAKELLCAHTPKASSPPSSSSPAQS